MKSGHCPAIYSYTEYLSGIDSGQYENVAAPQVAIDYWKLPPGARLRDVILLIRDDEAGHRDVNHDFPNRLKAYSISKSSVSLLLRLVVLEHCLRLRA